jgi:predicted nucleic acid binding AN1-type Zn finger protein
MKIKKEVWVEVCDVCGEEKNAVCSLCGIDVCTKHSLNLVTNHYPKTEGSEGYLVFTSGVSVARLFCPNHLSGELKELLNKKLEEVNDDE